MIFLPTYIQNFHLQINEVRLVFAVRETHVNLRKGITSKLDSSIRSLFQILSIIDKNDSENEDKSVVVF